MNPVLLLVSVRGQQVQRRVPIQLLRMSLPARLKRVIQMMIGDLSIGEKKEFVRALGRRQTDSFAQERFGIGESFLEKTEATQVDVGWRQPIVKGDRLLQRLARFRVVSQIRIQRTQIVICSRIPRIY